MSAKDATICCRKGEDMAKKIGRPAESEGPRKMVAVRLPEDVVLQMQHYALDHKKPLGEIFAALALEWWEKEKNKAA